MEYPQNTIATRNHSEKTSRNNSMLAVIKSIALLFLFFCGVNVVWAENELYKSPYDDITDPTPDNLPTYSGTCEDLYPVSDFNNLLTQIYRHLDDDCLYLMSTDELSEKLGIQVYAFYDREKGKFDYSKDRFEELFEQPFTDFRNAVFLEKLVFSNEGKIKTLTVKQQREARENIGKSRDSYNYATMTYKIFLSYAYLDHLPSPFYKDIPTQLPVPDFSAPSVTCKHINKDILYIRGKQNTWLKSETTNRWNGYVGYLDFENCNTGANLFSFEKFFYLD